MWTLRRSIVAGGVGSWADDVWVSRRRLMARLRNRVVFGTRARLAAVDEWRRRVIVEVGGVAKRARRGAVVQGEGVVVVMMMLVVGRRRRQSAVRLDVWCQARTGGPGRTGWQAVPVEPKVVVNVVRLQVVTGPIEKWVWVR